MTLQFWKCRLILFGPKTTMIFLSPQQLMQAFIFVIVDQRKNKSWNNISIYVPSKFFLFYRAQEAPLIFIPEEGGKQCRPAQSVSSIGFLALVVSIVNAVLIASNNINNNNNKYESKIKLENQR